MNVTESPYYCAKNAAFFESAATYYDGVQGCAGYASQARATASGWKTKEAAAEVLMDRAAEKTEELSE